MAPVTEARARTISNPDGPAVRTISKRSHIMTHHTLSSLTVAALGAVLLGCSTASSNGGATSSSPAASAVVSAATTEGWRNLIDPSMSAWRGYRAAAMPAEWTVENGVLSKVKSTNDIVTRDEY